MSLMTLGVTDLESATRFYEECLGLPRLTTPPSVTFFELGQTWLALWSRERVAADAGLSPAGVGFPGFALAHNVRASAEVDVLLARVTTLEPPWCSLGTRQTGAGTRATSQTSTGFFGRSRTTPVSRMCHGPTRRSSRPASASLAVVHSLAVAGECPRPGRIPLPNKGMQATASSLRYAPAFSRA